MNNLFNQVKSLIEELVAEFTEAKQGGLTWNEMMRLVGSIIRALMIAAEGMYDGETGQLKKDEVLAALGQAYDQYLAPIDVSRVPNVIEPVFDRMAKQGILIFAEFMIDVLYDQMVEDAAAFEVKGHPFFATSGPEEGGDPNEESTEESDGDSSPEEGSKSTKSE